MIPTEWHKVNDPEEIHQLHCDKALAVLGGCGPSTKPEHYGEFWWHAKQTPVSETQRGYSKTLDEAKAAMMEALQPYFAYMERGFKKAEHQQ